MGTRVLLVDDHALMRKGLRLLVEQEEDMSVVGEAGDGQEAIELAQQLSPDVVVMDITMPGLNGVEATRQIVSANPKAKVVALSIHSGRRFVEDMLQAGAAGYMLKASTPEELVEGIRAAVRGEVYLSPAITGVVVSQYVKALSGDLAPAAEGELTPSERETLRMVGKDRSGEEIASALGGDAEAIEAVQRGIMKKLGVNSMAELAEIARQEGLVVEAGQHAATGRTTPVPILATKLHRPAVAPDILPRARLTELLDEGHGRPLTLISAPAGYGKSTLASRWVADCDCPSAWVSLDAGDGDLRVFLSYVLAAVHAAFPEAGGTTEPALAAPNLPPASALARSLINDLDEIDEDLILVLDDYHRVAGTAVHDLLADLLSHPPQGMHLVLLTRRDPPLPIGTLRARGQVTEVRAADLRFTPDETAAFLEQVLKAPIDTNTAAVLEEKTEGWVTGLRLAALSLRNREDLQRMARNLQGDFHYIADYLLTEVVSRQSEGIASYLIEASLFDRFCAPLCKAVHAEDPEPAQGEGSIDAEGFIEWLEKANLFVIPLDEQRRWFRYHHLFQDLLQDQWKRRHRPEDAVAIHARASAWFAANGLVEEAIQHALSAGDPAQAAGIVERNRLAVQDADSWFVLARWLAMLPDSVLKQSPQLLLAQAWMLNHQFRVSRMPAVLDAAESLLGSDAGFEALRGEIDYYRGYFCYFQDEGTRALTYLRSALAQIPFTHHEVRGEAEIMYGLAAQMEGEEEEALDTLADSLHSGGQPHGVRTTRLLAGLVYIHLIAGRLLDAARPNRQLGDVSAKGNYRYAHVWAIYLEGLIALYRNDLAAAVRHLGLAVEERYVLHVRASVDAMTGLALASQAIQRPDRADEALRLLGDYVGGLSDSSYLALADSARTRLAMLRGDLASSAQWLRKSGVPDTEVMIWWLDIPAVTYCRALLAEGSAGSVKQAEGMLLEHLKANEANHNVRQMIDMLALLSIACQKQGRDEEAIGMLQRAVELAEPGGFLWPFLELGPPMVELLGRLEDGSPSRDFIGRLLAAFAGKERGVASAVSASEPDGLNSSGVEAPAAGLLTRRELDVLPLLAEGLSNKEIARKLHIATETVKTHLSSVYRKLGVDGRIPALRKAVELGLLPRD